MDDDPLLKQARRRVKMKIGFYLHAAIYLLVNAALMAANLVTGGPRWHLAPLLGWGLGLAIHGLVTLMALRGDGLRERMVADEVQRLRSRQ
jgi:2TM domain